MTFDVENVDSLILKSLKSKEEVDDDEHYKRDVVLENNKKKTSQNASLLKLNPTYRHSQHTWKTEGIMHQSLILSKHFETRKMNLG